MERNHWRWKEKREQQAFLALEDGTVMRGYSFGADVDRVGEVVFNTGMTGYQEIISDPSYCGQLVTMTYPEIGNTGINSVDNESQGIFLNGVIIHELNKSNNWRSEESIETYLTRHDVPAIAGIDTRALTTKLRKVGTLKGYLCATGSKTPKEGVVAAKEWEGLDGQDYASKVTCNKMFEWDTETGSDAYWALADKLPPCDLKVVAYDFGIKWNILRHMRICGLQTTIVPAHTNASDIMKLKPDGVFFL